MKNPWLTFLTFMILGPLVGLVQALIYASAPLHFGNFVQALVYAQLSLSPHFGALLFLAYVFGGLPATVAGIVIATLGRPSLWQVTLAGIVVGLAFGFLRGLLYNWGYNDDASYRISSTVEWMADLGLFCIVPTIVCWLIVQLLGSGIWTRLLNN
jgi:hypothetical protein